ncbi:MAG: hypothetical protein ABI613_08405 [Gemmatimonadota bacterium]
MSVLRPSLALAFTALLLTSRAAKGQSVQDRRALEAFRDSIAVIADAGQLARIAKAAEHLARSRRSDPVPGLRHGLSLLRRAEIEGRLFDRAREAFERADRAGHKLVYSSYGVGLAEEGKGDWLASEPANIGIRVGYGAYQAAVRAFLTTLTREADFEPALQELARLSEVLRDTATTRIILGAHQRAAARGVDATSFLLDLGRLERQAGSLDSSIAIFSRVAKMTCAPSTTLLELARTTLARDTAESALYQLITSSDDSIVLAGIRADLAPIAAASEMLAFDGATSGKARADLLRRFWSRRDAIDLRAPGERLHEHYRRLLYVRQHYALSSNRRYYGSSDLYRAAGNDIDDRGVIYLRQGEPDLRLTPLLYGLNPNETWVYHRADGDLVLHFSSGGQGTEGGDLADFRLVGSVLDLRGRDVPQDMLLLSRVPVSVLYDRMLAWGPFGAARAAREERSLGESSAAEALGSDRDPLQFTSPLNAAADLVSVGLDGTQSLTHLAFSLDLDHEQGTPGTSVPIHVRLVLMTGPDSVAGTLDTVATALVNDEHRATGMVSLRVPAGDFLYRVALMVNDSVGTVLPISRTTIPAYAAGQLAISGLALGRQGSSAQWYTASGDTILIVPQKEFEPDGDLHLYYEIYGLDPGESYQTAIAVYERNGDRAGRSRLKFAFEGRSIAMVTREKRALRLSGIAPGNYWLEVTVFDRYGGRVTSRQPLRISHPERTSRGD